MSDVVERAKNSLNMYRYCRASGVERGLYPERLMSELVSELCAAEAKLAAIRRQCTDFTPSPDLADAVLAILDGDQQ